MQDRRFCIYVHKNNINGKIYIGQTCQTPKARWKNGNGYNGRHFRNAIKKYGWENFSHFVLIDHLTQEQANLIQPILIEKYNTRNPNKGYNVQKGGESHAKTLDERIRRETEYLQSKYSGKQLERQIRLRIYRNKDFFPDAPGGPVKGEDHFASKPVICLETLEVFCNSKQAQQKMSLHSDRGIRAACSHQVNSAYGYHWEFYDPSKTYTKIQKQPISRFGQVRHNGYKSRIKCIETGEIFESSRDAADKYGLCNGTHIIECCKGKRKTCAKYHWCYADEEVK